MTLVPFLAAAGAFTAVKHIFSVFSWFEKNGSSDHLIRAKLDNAFDRLETMSIGELLAAYWQRLSTKVEKTFAERKSAWRLWLIATGLALFLLLVAFCQMLYSDPQFGISRIGLFLRDSRIIALVPSVLIVAMISLKVSVALMRRSKRTRSIHAYWGLIAWQLVVLYMATALSFVPPMVQDIRTGVGVQTAVSVFLRDAATPSLGISAILHNWFVFSLWIAAAYPSLIFLVLACIVLGAYSLPLRAKQLVSQAIFNVTTDKSPVLEQLGTAFGALASAATFLATL
jgi:hypothetical protein